MLVGSLFLKANSAAMWSPGEKNIHTVVAKASCLGTNNMISCGHTPHCLYLSGVREQERKMYGLEEKKRKKLFNVKAKLSSN